MLNRNALILALGLWSMAATAQVPVVEAGSRQGQPAAAQGGGNELIMTLYTQLEALQQEMQTLRGMVEEQSNQIRRMQNEQRDRYLDVDRRLSELSGGGVSTEVTLPGNTVPEVPAGGVPAVNTLPPATTGTQLPPPTVNDPQGLNRQTQQGLDRQQEFQAASPQVAGGGINQAPLPGGPTAGADLGEQDLYRTALNLLLEQEGRAAESIQLFQSYIERFPQGRLLTNALYWQGEAFIIESRFQEAQAVFTHLITSYPDGLKAPDAMLKLGVVYDRMGDRARAEQTWRDIATTYPDAASAIRIAQGYLNQQ